MIDAYQTVEKHRHMVLRKLDERKFISNRRLILIDRMKKFIHRTRFQRKYVTLNVDEQTLRTCDIEQMLRRLYQAEFDQRRGMAASKLQAYIRKRQKMIALATYLGAVIMIQRYYRKRLIGRDFYVSKKH